MNGVSDFERFLDELPSNGRCILCKFFRSHPEEGEQIMQAVKRRGTYFGQGSGPPRRNDSKITPRQIAWYISTRYPEQKMTQHNVYDHFRNGHEEGEWKVVSKSS